MVANVKNKLVSGIFSWPSLLIYSSFIVTVSVVPLESPPQMGFPLFDKVVHSFSYFLLAVLSVNTFAVRRYTVPRVSGFFYSFLLGFCMEIVQLFLPFRQFELKDLAANFIGSVAGCLLLFL